MKSFEISSTVQAPTETVWAHCTSMKGVSRELSPLVKMTYPEGHESLVPDSFVPRKRLFRSWLLLFGLIPVDRSDLTIVELEPGRRFLESSPMATQRKWAHERMIEPVEGGTRVVDRLQWEGRFPGTETAFAIVVPILFRWRHHRLQQIFG